GLFGAFEVFIDTIVICTMTALVILVAAPNIWHSGLNGVELTFSAFQQFYGKWGTGIVAIGVLLAAFSTMVGYYIEYETSVVYLFGQKAVRFFRWIYLIPPFIAVSLSVEFVWTIVDISTGIEGLPNMLALLLLSGKFVQLFNDYKKEHM
ncbi:MAG TPA: sodium:alanine symporter family protein, partial [Aminobacterium sp.]|nr:sodium:alanine symporter family protein [Aminobacterium sp.]